MFGTNSIEGSSGLEKPGQKQIFYEVWNFVSIFSTENS